MSGSFGGSGRGGMSGNPMDAMWDAMEQLKQGFEKRAGSRMGRGDVRASILVLLAERPMHGYQVIREIEDRTGGRWKPSAGSVYPTLQLLADEGLVAATTAEDRKVYSLTEAGEEAAAGAAGSAPWESSESPAGGHASAIPKAGFELAQAAAQAARSGSADQQRLVVEALDAARRRIYSILAQD